MTHVFVSGCYDVLHAGHLQFFKEAKALGTHLTVNFASANVLLNHKQRVSSLPDEHKQALLEAMEIIDEVCIGDDPDLGLDFKSNFLRTKP
ncbi:MAG TPA: cytidyltransferase, partial [Verrucomicrobia bacterium]|nr:cytidyltransferase [Verrucomicrobiota bacterium]